MTDWFGRIPRMVGCLATPMFTAGWSGGGPSRPVLRYAREARHREGLGSQRRASTAGSVFKAFKKVIGCSPRYFRAPGNNKESNHGKKSIFDMKESFLTRDFR